MKYIGPLFIFFISCHPGKTTLLPKEIELVKDSVRVMTDNISRDLSVRGPIVWLDYFEDSPDFFMVSDGVVVFKDFQTARKFITDTLVRTFTQIILRWDHPAIDPLTNQMATISSGFHEELKDSAGKSIFSSGYFSAVAEKTNRGWQLKNAYWSIRKP
jgi:hypothetical protein